MKHKFLIFVCLIAFSGFAQSESEKDEHGHDHAAEEAESEAPESVGPDKGIVAYDEHDGFKLSAEATKNFEIRSQKLSGSSPWSLPKVAIVHSGSEVNLYRMRDGFIKRVDFNTANSSAETITVSSKDLRTGDEILIAGLGFVRIAELAATGGMAEGHSH